MKGILLFLFASMALAGCSDSYDSQFNGLEKRVSNNRVGEQDFWLAKGTMGYPDKVALFFGYADDYAACMEVADTLNSKYQSAFFSCIPAN